MRYGYECKCDKCGYKFDTDLGIGFRFLTLKTETEEAMKKGDYGLEAKEFFEAFPDGTVSCERVAAKCRSCGEYFVVLSLDMFVRKSEDNAAKPEYEFFQGYDHRCTKCGEHADIVEDFVEKLKKGQLKCSKCDDGTIIIVDEYLWD